MDELDILQYTSIRRFAVEWVSRHPLGPSNRLMAWMGGQLGCSRSQVWNLLTGDEGRHRFAVEQVPALARIFTIQDSRRREHLRRLVVRQGAGPDEAKDALVAVWESHAAETGLPPEILEGVLERAPIPGCYESPLLAMLPLIEEHAPWVRTPAQISSLLIGGPDPDFVASALELRQAGHQLGLARGPRMRALPEPDDPHGWEVACWHGLFELGRESLLRVPAAERDYYTIVGSVDEAAVSLTPGAFQRLLGRVREIVRRSAEKRVWRVYALLLEEATLCQLRPPRPGVPRPAPETTPRNLLTRRYQSKNGEQAVSFAGYADGRPCLFHHMELAPYAQEWIAWRKGRNKPASAAWLAQQWGCSRAQAHALTTGAAKFHPDYVSRVVATMGLLDHEAPYAAGLARLAVTTDKVERARERLLLVEYAAKQGVRTLDGDSFRVASHWGSGAILALSSLRPYVHNPAWISLGLGGRLPWQQAEVLMDALTETRLLVGRADGPPRPAALDYRPSEESARVAGYAYHDSVLRLLRAEVALPFRGARFRGCLLALPEEALPAVKRAVLSCREDLESAGREAASRGAADPDALDRVVLQGAHLFPITTDLRAR